MSHAGFLPDSTSRSMGSRRNLIPVAANKALASAGGAAVVPVSPIPPGAYPLLMRCTSICGISLIRSIR
jgi:hypothetical protein